MDTAVASEVKAKIVRQGVMKFDGGFSREVVIDVSGYNSVDDHFRPRGVHRSVGVWSPMLWHYALIQFNQTVRCGELADDPSLYISEPGRWEWAGDTLGLLFGYKEKQNIYNPVVFRGDVFSKGKDKYLSYVQLIGRERNLAVKEWDWPWPDECLFLIGYEVHSLVTSR